MIATQVSYLRVFLLVVFLNTFAAWGIAVAQSPAPAQTAEPQSSAPASPLAAVHVFNVRDFGAVGNATKLDTIAINKSIIAAHLSGGGTVLIPPGIYLSGTIELLSNVTLDLSAGATLRGSPDVADYKSLANYGFGHTNGPNISGEGLKAGLILANDADNVGIVGQGRIDGNGDSFFDFDLPHVGIDFDPRSVRNPDAFMQAITHTDQGPVWMKPENRPGTMIIFWHCRNVVLHDVMLSNAPNWTLHLQSTSYATLTGFHIINDLKLPNNDGMDVISSHHIHISNCDIAAGDDAFAFYDSQDVSAANCALTSYSSGVRLESTRNATFNDLVIDANRGIGLYARGGGDTADVLFSNLVIQTHLIEGGWWGKAEPIFLASAGAGENGRVYDVRFTNVLANAESGILLYASHPGVVRGITLDNVKLSVHAPRKDLAAALGGNFDLRWVATNLSDAVFKHDIPAIYSHNIDDLTIRNCEVTWDGDLPNYFSSAIEADNFRQLSIDGFTGRQGIVGSQAAAIALSHGVGVSIRNSRATVGTNMFFDQDDVAGQGLFAVNDLANARTVSPRQLRGFTLYGNLMPPHVRTGSVAH